MLLDDKTADLPREDTIVVARDLNGHVGATKDGYRCHGGFGYGTRNQDGERILEYADSHNLVIANTRFPKRQSHLITFYSGNTKTQIDFVLIRQRDKKLVTNAKVVPYETVTTQHRPLICTMKITPTRQKRDERCGQARIKWWRWREKEADIISRIHLPLVTTVEETWQTVTRKIGQVVRSELGMTKPNRRRIDKQTWLWTDEMKAKVLEKKRLYHTFLCSKPPENWRSYKEAKKAASGHNESYQL